MTAECKYKEMGRQLKEQFINALNDDLMTDEIICEFTSLSDINSVTFEQVIPWVRRVEAQRAKRAVLDSLKKN